MKTFAEQLERDRLLTPEEAALVLGFGGNRDPGNAVRRLAREEGLTFIRFGTHYRFRRSDLDEFITAHVVSRGEKDEVQHGNRQ